MRQTWPTIKILVAKVWVCKKMLPVKDKPISSTKESLWNSLFLCLSVCIVQFNSQQDRLEPQFHAMQSPKDSTRRKQSRSVIVTRISTLLVTIITALWLLTWIACTKFPQPINRAKREPRLAMDREILFIKTSKLIKITWLLCPFLYRIRYVLSWKKEIIRRKLI